MRKFICHAIAVIGALSSTTTFADDDNLKASLLEVAKRRQLSSEDIIAAVSTYTPANKKDEFICLNSGGQAASMIAYGVPSMRILKYIPTGSPDSSTGYNYDEQSRSIIAQGRFEGAKITWGDTHHPGFSETDGKYDGRYVFINDKANPRIFVIDLRDFETKQIVTNPIFMSSHGGAFPTPNSEYIIEGAQYPAPTDRKYRPLTQDNFNKYWRGGITFHKFDNDKGRIVPNKSFTVIAPPYSQDLSDAGKGESYGYSFTNSFCAERYATGFEEGRPPYEAGCSAKDTDYLHVVDWKRAEQLVAAGKYEVINKHKVIPLKVAAEEGVLVLIPEPKSPHGADVSPDGRFIIVAGKLDTHASVYDIRKIKDLIKRKEYAGKDPYGVPILDMKKSLHGQVQLGLGPLHTQFDVKEGIAYTSIYIDSVVAKWDYINLKLLDKVSVHYNIGHLVSMQGDSQDPRGKYVIALNKLAIDRFNAIGPLHPQNHQLIDTSGDKMRVIYDLPLPLGEPHYTVCIDAEKIKPWEMYPVGTDSSTMAKSPLSVERGKERVTRKGSRVDVYGTVSSNGMQPLRVSVNQGDDVYFHLTNVEQQPNRTFKFNVHGYNALGVLPPGKFATVHFKATQSGIFNYKAAASDSALDPLEFGWLAVKPHKNTELKRQQLVDRQRRERLSLRKIPERPELNAVLAEGEREFVAYGCGGCHQIGREAGGPDLTDVTIRHNEEWLVKWITNPADYYDDPSISALIGRFGVKMPDQGVTDADAKKIVAYLKTLTSAPPASSEGSADAGPGEATYNKSCFACHGNGIAGAPKIGDAAQWGERISQGNETLYKHALEGFQGKVGYMPPKGGCVDCSDEDVKAAVDYMTSKVK